MKGEKQNSITVSNKELRESMAEGWAEDPYSYEIDGRRKDRVPLLDPVPPRANKQRSKCVGMGINATAIPIVISGYWEFHSRGDIDKFIEEIEQARDRAFGNEATKP